MPSSDVKIANHRFELPMSVQGDALTEEGQMNVSTSITLRALHTAGSLLLYLARARRRPLSLLLGAGLLASSLGAPVPVGAAAEPPNPAARLQFVVNQIQILDDRDGAFAGKGELHFYIDFYRCNGNVPCLDQLKNSDWGSATGVYDAQDYFTAGTGQTVTMNRVIPEDNAPVPLGLAIAEGGRYVMKFRILEFDDLSGAENLGSVFHELDFSEHGLGIGTHVGRATGADGGHVGDFIITYEIRRAPLPDLRAGGIKVKDLPGSTNKQVCIGVLNAEIYASDAFEVALSVDGKIGPEAKARVNGLGGGDSEEVCIPAALPATGQALLAAVIDPANAVAEFNEANNTLKEPYQGTGLAIPESPATPTPAPGGSKVEEIRKPDLNVATIKVNGHEPDGKNDCQDGKNTVVVVVKNDGTESAEKITVQLAVDGGQTVTKLIASLEPGEAAEATFADVGLKKGQQKLTATVDPKNVIDEFDDGNNDLTVKATCASK
jgi:hypothetical protein